MIFVAKATIISPTMRATTVLPVPGLPKKPRRQAGSLSEDKVDKIPLFRFHTLSFLYWKIIDELNCHGSSDSSIDSEQLALETEKDLRRLEGTEWNWSRLAESSRDLKKLKSHPLKQWICKCICKPSISNGDLPSGKLRVCWRDFRKPQSKVVMFGFV